MSTKTTTILAVTIITLATLAGLLLWNQLPDQMVSHWNINDQADGVSDKLWGVFLFPIISVGIFLLLLAVPAIDPLKENVAQFRESFNAFILLILVFLAYVYGLTLAWNLGYTGFRMSAAMLPALGLLFFFMGVMMSKAKRNFFIGIRTPWTLSSDRVWDETHRVGGLLFKISGAVALVGAFIPTYAFWFMFVPLMGSTLFIVIYSYVLYRRETHHA